MDRFNMQEAIRAISVTMFNQLVLGMGFSAVLYLSAEQIFKNAVNDRESMLNVPSFWVFLRDGYVTYHLFELTFYPMHKLMHWKPIYNRVHKVHHEWKHPISVAAVYNHPLEYMTASFIPLMIGPTLCGSHISTLWIIIFSSIITVVSEHSGYHMPYLKSARFHYYHHTHPTECLGSYGLLDYIFGTDTKFRKSKEFEHHRVFFTPIKAKDE